MLSHVLPRTGVLRRCLPPADSKFGYLIGNLVVKMNRVMTTHSRNTPVSPRSQKQYPMSPVLLAWSLSQRASRDAIIQATIEYVTSFLLLGRVSYTVR